MAARALEAHDPGVGAGQLAADAGDEFAHRQAGLVVQRIDRIAGELLEQPVLDHLQAPGAAFLCGLKDAVHGACKIGIGLEIARRAQQHRGMAIMAATVKLARNGRFMPERIRFGHVQRIHVGTQPNGPVTGPVALDHGNDPGACQPLMRLDAPFCQLVHHDARCAVLFVTGFRVHMDIVSQGDHFIFMLAQRGKDLFEVHDFSSQLDVLSPISRPAQVRR